MELSELADDLWSMMTQEKESGRVARSFRWTNIEKLAPDDSEQDIKLALGELIRHGVIEDTSDQLADVILVRHKDR